MCWAKAVASTVATAALLSAQTGLAPEVVLLARIKAKMAKNLARLPNYTCLQSVERSRRSGASQKLQLLDTVRLEVAYVDGKELFAWPGADRFEERDLSDLAPDGAMGNGSFALHARSVFLSNAATFRFLGETVESGRRLVTYSYSVPEMMSGYHVRVGRSEGVVGYRGAFVVDAESLDLVRLDIEATGIPPQLQLLSVTEELRYQRAQIGDSTFLLPHSSEMVITGLSGNESRNRTLFTGCRQYTGESVITFEDPPEGEPKPASQPEVEIALPPGIHLEVALASAIDLRSAAVGDPVIAQLGRAVKLAGEVIAPKGAGLSGRIVRLERQHRDFYAIALAFTSIQFDNQRGALSSRLNEVQRFAGQPDRLRQAPADPEVIVVQKSLVRIPAGLRLTLVTVAEARR